MMNYLETARAEFNIFTGITDALVLIECCNNVQSRIDRGQSTDDALYTVSTLAARVKFYEIKKAYALFKGCHMK